MAFLKIRDIGRLLKHTGKSWYERDPFRQSAIIAYYAIFSLPALLTIVIAVAGLVFGREAVSGQVYNQIHTTIGPEAAKGVQAMLAQASQTKDSWLATIIGLATLIIGATAVFAQFQKSLNIIWEVEADPKKSGIKSLIKTRLFSFGLIVSIGFLLLISLVITSILTVFSNWIRERFPDVLLYLLHILNFLISFGVVTLLFALMFKFLPDAKVKWRYVWIGSVVTSLMFVIGKSLIGLYFGKSDPASVYGAAGSVILILLWVSYSSMIVFFGAEFTRSYADLYGNGVEPGKNAVKAEGRGRE